MTELQQFLHLSAQKAADDEHRFKIAKAVGIYEHAVSQTRASQFKNWQEARALAAAIKDEALSRLPDFLEQFEENFSARGGRVFWAETAGDAAAYILQVAQSRHAKKVVKSKSMTTEEIALNEQLEAAGMEVWESDLGELIVQLAGEKPYHIVTPAMHKSKEEIARLFHEKLDAPLTGSAEELTMVARRHLRQAYVTSDIGITGGNFLIADAGAVLVTENEGNARLTMSCPPVHIAVAGIEKMIPRLSDLSLFLPLLATSGTGQQITCYNSLLLGPRQPLEQDGPAEMHVVLLDNGRSDLYAKENFREALRCIRCGACLNACPVYRTIGGHSYRATYQGPIGSVITPHYNDFSRYRHLSAASSLCGACSDVCPVQIDIHHLLLENRRQAAATEAAFSERVAMRAYGWIMSRAGRLQALRKVLRPLQSFAGLFSDVRRSAPLLSKKSFHEIWQEHERQP